MLGALFGFFQTLTSSAMQVVRTIIPPLQYPAPQPNFAAPAPGVTTGQLVNSTSTIQCMWGSAPIPLVMLPPPAVNANLLPVQNTMAKLFPANIATFGQCKSMTNPGNAAFPTTGVLVPCVPTVAAPWIPGCAHTMIGGLPAVNTTCTCICTLGAGTIKVNATSAPTINVG